jgi:hypothetical protein
MSGVLTTMFTPSGSTITFAFADYEDAFDHVQSMVRMARNLPKKQFASLLPRMRDQILLNFSRWLTDGKMSEAARKVFVQLCARQERTADTNDIRLITAFQAADALTAAAVDGRLEAWPDFEARLSELKVLMMEDSCS